MRRRIAIVVLCAFGAVAAGNGACAGPALAAAELSAGASPGSLLDAARDQNRKAAFTLLDQRADANDRSSDGTTALHWAAHFGDVELVKRLLKAGANPKAVNDYGASPMSEAAELGDAGILEQLLKAGADVESPNGEGQTALMTVARTNHIDAALVLLKHKANVNAREQWRGQTALMWASAQSQPEMVELLIKHKADVNARSDVRDWARKVSAEPRPQNRPLGGFTALLLAAREGCVACAEALVKQGKADINLGDPDNITPLNSALLNGRWDVAASLIKLGANVNRWDTWGRAPLYSAVDFNTTPRGGRPDRPSDDKTTGVEVIQMLLERGANPNMQLKLFPPYRSLGQDRGGDSMLTVGTTPLIRAAKAGDTGAVKLLLAHGALPNLPNSLGITPLMAAAGIGSTTIDIRARFRNEDACIDTGKLLVTGGANVNATNENGQTALHGAALWGWTKYAQFLAENGANLEAKDRFGARALDVALGKNSGTGRGGLSAAEPHPETAALLQKLAAKN